MTPYYDRKGRFLGYTHHHRDLFNLEGQRIGCLGYPGLYDTWGERVGWLWHYWLLDIDGCVLAAAENAPDTLIAKPSVCRPATELRRLLERPADFVISRAPMPAPHFEWSKRDPFSLLIADEEKAGKAPCIFFNRKGKPAAYTTHWNTLFTMDGEPCGYFQGGCVFNLALQQVAWFSLGWLLDNKGRRVAFERGAPGPFWKPLVRIPEKRPEIKVELQRPVLKQFEICPLIRASWSPQSLKNLLMKPNT